MKKFVLSFLFLSLVVAIAVVPASAGTVYTTGQANGNSSAWQINGTVDLGTGASPQYPQAQVSDSFTATGEGDLINGVTFAAWLAPGDTISNIDWSIGTNPYGTQLGKGMAAVTYVACAGAGLCLNGSGFNVDTESFSTTNVYLGPGTYYLTLSSATVTGGDPTGWDENDGISQGFTNDLAPTLPDTTPPYPWSIGAYNCGYTLPCSNTGGETFSLNGSFLPEPSSFLLLGSGLAGLAGMLKRKLRA